MAPKKKEVQKLSLGEFMQDTSFGGSWADEVEDTYASGTQAFPSSDRRGPTGSSSYGGGYGGGGGDRGYASIRDNLPQQLPTKPPYTAHLGNLSYEATTESVNDFFHDCTPINVRIIEDREQNRPKGFAYAEFSSLDDLKTALTRDGQMFEGRNIRIKVADPPKDRGDRGGESNRDLSDWTRKGPLTDLPSRGGDRRGPSDFGERRAPSDFGERRPPRDGPPADDGRVRDFGNWERKGPLSPLPQQERAPAMSREGSRARLNDAAKGQEGFRDRRASPATWGEGTNRQDGSRPPRREFVEKPERAPTAAERDNQWRSNMRPDAPAAEQSREGSEAPPSPAGATPAVPAAAGRPKLNLAKRTVSETVDATSPAQANDSKASPFGAARPIDSAAREKEIAEKREALLKEKKEAEEKAKEERRLAKEAAAKEAAEKAATEAEKAASASAADDSENAGDEKEAGEQAKETEEAGGAEQPKIPRGPRETREPREPREPRENISHPKSRATESGNWRSASSEQRVPSRGGHAPGAPRGRGGAPRGPRGGGEGGRGEGRPPRANGSGPPPAVHQSSQQGSQASAAGDSAPPTPTIDEDGWTTVPGKSRRGRA